MDAGHHLEFTGSQLQIHQRAPWERPFPGKTKTGSSLSNDSGQTPAGVLRIGSCEKIKEGCPVIRSYHQKARVAAKLEKGTKNAEALGWLGFFYRLREGLSTQAKFLSD